MPDPRLTFELLLAGLLLALFGGAGTLLGRKTARHAALVTLFTGLAVASVARGRAAGESAALAILAVGIAYLALSRSSCRVE